MFIDCFCFNGIGIAFNIFTEDKYMLFFYPRFETLVVCRVSLFKGSIFFNDLKVELFSDSLYDNIVNRVPRKFFQCF